MVLRLHWTIFVCGGLAIGRETPPDVVVRTERDGRPHDLHPEPEIPGVPSAGSRGPPRLQVGFSSPRSCFCRLCVRWTCRVPYSTTWSNRGLVRIRSAKLFKNLPQPKLSSLWCGGFSFSKCHAGQLCMPATPPPIAFIYIYNLSGKRGKSSTTRT